MLVYQRVANYRCKDAANFSFIESKRINHKQDVLFEVRINDDRIIRFIPLNL